MGGQLVKSVLMFDNPNGRRATRDIINGKDYSIKLMNARPLYSTSDDCLVAIANEQKATAATSLYVTSDRELAHRLLATGNITYHIISLACDIVILILCNDMITK